MESLERDAGHHRVLGDAHPVLHPLAEVVVGTDHLPGSDQLTQAGVIDVLVDVGAFPGYVDGSRERIRQRRSNRLAGGRRLAGGGVIEVAGRLRLGLDGRDVIPALLEQARGKVRLGQVEEHLH